MAFLTDPSIALQVKSPNLAQVYLQAQQIRNGQQEQQMRSLSLAQATQAMKDEADVRAAYSSPDPVAALKQTNPKAAAGLQVQLDKQAADKAKATGEQRKLDLENNLKKVQGLGQLAGAATPQNWAQVKQAAVTQFGADPNAIPDQFDPNVVKQYQQQAMTAEQQITAALQQHNAEETARHNKSIEEHERDTSTMQGRAIEIYAKPKNQWTPEEAAFVKGYEKNVDVTKTQPGAVRAQIYAQMPIAVYNPDTGATEYSTKAGAIGKQAPNTIQNVTDKALVKDFTSGKAAQNLTAFNTASAHLDQLDKAADALKNGDMQAINRIGNEFAKQTGNPAPTNFQAIKSAVAGEVSKTFKGGQATDAEIKEFESAISSTNSPAQLKQVIKTYKGLMASKRDALKEQFEAAKSGQPNFGTPGGASSTPQPAQAFDWNAHPVAK